MLKLLGFSVLMSDNVDKLFNKMRSDEDEKDDDDEEEKQLKQ